METSEDERIRGEDKKVSFSNLNPGSPTPSLRDPDSGSGNNEIEAISDQIPGIAPRQRTEQEATMFSTSEAGLTALVPLAPLTAPALQAPQSAKKPKHKRQWSQEREESPRKEIIAKRVVSLQELHRRRGLTLFQFFWEQGMNCVPPDDHPFWHNDKDDFEPYENFWAPSRGPQWDDPIWHNDYDEETFQSFFNLNPGGPKPCFWNEDGSFSERVFRLFFDSIPGVASSSKDAEHIAAISGTTSASSQIASSSYSAWPPSAVPAIRKRNQYRPRRGNFKLLQDTGMPFPKLVNKIVPIDELHRRRSLTLLQFFQEMGMPSIPPIGDPFWSNEICSYPGWYCNYGVGPQGNNLAWHNDYKKETGESFFNMHPKEHSPESKDDDSMDMDDGFCCISPPSRDTNKGKRQI